MLLIQTNCIFFDFTVNNKYLYVLVKLFSFMEEKNLKYAYFKRHKMYVINSFLDKLEVVPLQYYVDYKYVYVYIEDLVNVLLQDKELYKGIRLCYYDNSMFIEVECAVVGKEVQELLKKLVAKKAN